MTTLGPDAHRRLAGGAGPKPGIHEPGGGEKAQTISGSGGSLAASEGADKQEKDPAMAASKTTSSPESANQPRSRSGDAVPGEPSPDGARTVSSVLGEITWLLTQSPLHKGNFFIGDLEWMVMPAILLEQFRIFYHDSDGRPVGVALWARVNEEVEQRLEAGGARMAPNDWRSGDQLWVVELIAPFGGQDEMLKDLQANVFGEEKPKMRSTT